jgi:predicted alpha/beta-fold hydrolase
LAQTDSTTKRIISSEFEPAWWLSHRHLQTIYPSMPWSYRHRPRLRREVLELPDGDVTAVDWVSNSNSGDTASPLLVILHGLESSAESSYARMLMNAVTDIGWRCCVLHFRDCGDTPNRLPRRYHAGETGDIRHFLDKLVADGNDGALFAVGYSLGGNVLLKYLGEVGDSTPLTAAVAVCVPLDLHLCAKALNIGFSKIYQRYLLKSMKESVRRKFDRHTAAFDWDRTMASVTFAEFDDARTAPLHGFNGKDDYYDKCSSASFPNRRPAFERRHPGSLRVRRTRWIYRRRNAVAAEVLPAATHCRVPQEPDGQLRLPRHGKYYQAASTSFIDRRTRP